MKPGNRPNPGAQKKMDLGIGEEWGNDYFQRAIIPIFQTDYGY